MTVHYINRTDILTLFDRCLADLKHRNSRAELEDTGFMCEKWRARIDSVSRLRKLVSVLSIPCCANCAYWGRYHELVHPGLGGCDAPIFDDVHDSVNTPASFFCASYKLDTYIQAIDAHFARVSDEEFLDGLRRAGFKLTTKEKSDA